MVTAPKALPAVQQGQGEGRGIASPDGFVAPGLEPWIGEHVGAQDRFTGPDRSPGGAPAPFPVGPGQVQRLQVPFVETGMGDGPHRFVIVVRGIADPDHGIAAILDDDSADLLQEGRFLLGAHEGLVAAAQRPERPVELSKLLFLLSRSVMSKQVPTHSRTLPSSFRIGTPRARKCR